ncbi:GNAT family N-acetyltransferase [Paucibacter sp. O1-1]|uniref:GNAT family N-acetyltransferase n=1 Tax=Roseateles TaxID=93681 RepID=UPI0021D4ED83|nr:GNAT family N-acetyltransferase [Paucibacter sp. XJ19-41]MCU7374356.1 GNAT family N-acetyltransferase [Paucibacter sp. O1-1]MDA3829358.1 GNAT family N-acetyltransferase [Paucibacter sp. O1-1]MDC6166855.1 GNAT family N-acetyltransferase [Paucibacter sp. XJ19-41]
MNSSALALEPSLARERPDQPEVLALIHALDTFQSQLYPAASNHLLDIEALLAPEVRFLVVRDAQARVQGCGAIVLREDCAELKRMMVRPEARGQGLGGALIAALEVEAVCAGRPLLRLETGVRQRPAIRLYERMGYRRCGPFGGYRADPFSVYMEKLLGA